MENIYSVASTSSSTTYGNVMEVFKEMIISNFPPNFFRDIHMASEISYTNIRRRLGRNTRNEFKKLERPFIVINPQIQPQEDGYLQNIPLTKNYDNIESGLTKATLFPIIQDPEHQYELVYKLNRDQIQFEITITLDTLIQQLDLYKYMVNHFVWERPFVYKTALESMIPRSIVSMMGKLTQIDVFDKNTNQTPIMLQWMNAHSVFPITYKMRNGTSLDEFFLYYTPSLLITYSDLSADGVNRRNMADDYFQITFRASVEFNLPGRYALIGTKPRWDVFDIDLDIVNNDNTHDIIPMFTVNNLFAKYSYDKNGFKLYTTTRFKSEESCHEKKDVLPFGTLFEDSYIAEMKTCYASNIPMNTLCKFILLENSKELVEDIDWRINWNTLEIEIIKSNKFVTYTLIVYVNNIHFMNTFIDRIQRNRIDKPAP